MITTLTGSNEFQLTAKQQQLVGDFVTQYGDMAVERLDGEDASIERIGEALTSVPFLADRKLVVLRKASANKLFIDKAAELLTGVPETTDVLLLELKLDKRSAYYKFLKKATEYHEFGDLDANALSRWLVDYAKKQAGVLSLGDASYLVNRIGPNQQLLVAELDKLLLYDTQVSRLAIDAMTDAAPQSTVFELLDAAFAGRHQQVLALYEEQRALKVEPQQIIAMLAWQLHIVALIKAGGDRSPEQIASEAKVSPYTVKKSLAIAKRTRLDALKTHIARLIDIDTCSKRETFALDDALQQFLLSLTK